MTPWHIWYLRVCPFLHTKLTVHQIEEIPNPSVEGPRIMLACVAIGVFTGFIFLVCLLLVAGNVDDVITNTAGPLLAIFYNATKSKAGSICLLM